MQFIDANTACENAHTAAEEAAMMGGRVTKPETYQRRYSLAYKYAVQQARNTADHSRLVEVARAGIRKGR